MVIVLIGWASRRRWQSSNEYLNASRSLPVWAAALSLLAYNCGSIEVIGMSAMAAQYGVQALHFYWIGGIPGMIFLGIVVLPIYMRTGARSLPQYLGMRFGARVRLLNAGISMAGTVGFAGVAIYALAQVLHVILGLDLLVGALSCVSVVLVYVLVGGLRATMFTSVFQLFVMIAGLTPLFFLTVHFNVATFAQRADRWHLWRPLPLINSHASLDDIGVVIGLGFVISFSYFCTDFVLIQRALTARTIEAARKVPILAGFGKLAFGPLIVLPGVAAPELLRGTHWSSFDQSIPALMALAYGPKLLALGASALVASLMAGLAGNVSGFSALWTEEIYRPYLRPGQSEKQYVRIGRVAIVASFALSLLAAYLTLFFRNLMEFLQLIAAMLYAPVFAAVLAGLFSRRITERGALVGILAGVFSAFGLQASTWGGLIHFGSQMTLNFYAAMLSFAVTALICFFYKGRRDLRTDGELKDLVFNKKMLPDLRLSPGLAVLGAILLISCLILNVLWR
jgi:SSS family solute:Na+ symporter